ncbi:MAG: hypothetical protein AMJ65_15295 [Phycisphaerae bacterium SG8_4]|nr:MAG: hypothetical protein AMJ65_15295 [Phycisphaerae bacterium SG8_4]
MKIEKNLPRGQSCDIRDLREPRVSMLAAFVWDHITLMWVEMNADKTSGVDEKHLMVSERAAR